MNYIHTFIIVEAVTGKKGDFLHGLLDSLDDYSIKEHNVPH